MEQYVDGDERAFEQLYRELRPALVASLRRWLKTDDKIDDALQIALMKMHRSRHRYRTGAPVIPWAVTIARNVALDYLRSRAAKDRSLSEEEAARIQAPEDASIWSEADEREVAAAVRDAIEALPESSRRVVELHKLEGLSMAEVAQILGIKEGAARVRAHRGYKALGKLLLGFHTQRNLRQ